MQKINESACGPTPVMVFVMRKDLCCTSSASVTVYIGNFNYMPHIFCDIFTNLSETKLC